MIVVDRGKVYKSGEFTEPYYEQFDPEVIQREKKNDTKPFLSQNQPQTVAEDIPSEQPDDSKSRQSAQDENPASDKAFIPEKEIHSIEERVRAEMEAKMISEKQVSYNEGIQAGKNAGKAENAAEIQRLAQLFTAIKTDFDSAAVKFFEEIEKIAMDMSVHLARKIIGDAVSSVPDIIKTNVDKCVNLLAGSGTVQIKINPNDYDIIKMYIPDLESKFEGKFSFILEPDNKIDRGGCLIDFEGSTIDGRIETQVDKIQKQMEMIT